MSATPVSASTKLAVVIGDPVEHSLSPVLHNAAFAATNTDAVFLALRVSPGNLASTVAMLRDAGALGASVTVPHKQAIIALCDRLAPSAEATGAVNCVELSEGAIVGHNTDAGGFVESLREAVGSAPDSGWRPLLLGGGGAARAVASGLESTGSAAPTVIARRPDRVAWTSARPWTAETLAETLPAHDLVIDCTSAGLSAERELALPCPIELDRCTASTVVSSLVYHRETALLAAAQKRGLRTLDGLGMLVHQALGALEIWLGEAPAANVLWNAVLAATGRQRREN